MRSSITNWSATYISRAQDTSAWLHGPDDQIPLDTLEYYVNSEFGRLLFHELLSKKNVERFICRMYYRDNELLASADTFIMNYQRLHELSQKLPEDEVIEIRASRLGMFLDQAPEE